MPGSCWRVCSAQSVLRVAQPVVALGETAVAVVVRNEIHVYVDGCYLPVRLNGGLCAGWGCFDVGLAAHPVALG